VDFAGVDDGPKPELRFRPRDRGVVLDEQCGQHRNQTAKHDRLRHVVVRPDQDEHAVAAVGQALQVLGAYPGRQQRSLYQLVQVAPEFAFSRIVPLGRSLNVERDYRTVHRAVRQPCVKALHCCEQNAHLPSRRFLWWILSSG
jgi:hypothetical protein